MKRIAFDKDLRRAHRAFGGCVLVLVIVALAHAWQRNWAYALTTALWAVSCLLGRMTIKSQQATRDEVRIARAGNHALLERLEKLP